MKDWTIMVYMAGDNNLSEDMVTGLLSMQRGFKNKDIALLVFYDAEEPTDQTFYLDFTNNKEYFNRYSQYEKEPNTEELRGEQRTSYYSICNFVQWCRERMRLLIMH